MKEPNEELEELKDVLEVEGILAKGYGIIAKLVMQDPRLTVVAKAIYAYFCAFAGTGRTAFPSWKKICKDLGIKKFATFKHHRDHLEAAGYIKVRQEIKEDGKFGRNIYTLIMNPVAVEDVKRPEDVGKSQLSPIAVSSESVEKRIALKANRSKQQSNNNSSLKINNDNKNNQSVSQSVLQEEPEEKETDRQTDEVHTLFEQAQVELFENEELKEHIKEAITQAYTQPATRNIIQRIRLEHIDRALAKFREAQEAKNIKNPKQYFFKCLISAITEHGLSATAWSS